MAGFRTNQISTNTTTTISTLYLRIGPWLQGTFLLHLTYTSSVQSLYTLSSVMYRSAVALERSNMYLCAMTFFLFKNQLKIDNKKIIKTKEIRSLKYQ